MISLSVTTLMPVMAKSLPLRAQSFSRWGNSGLGLGDRVRPLNARSFFPPINQSTAAQAEDNCSWYPSNDFLNDVQRNTLASIRF